MPEECGDKIRASFLFKEFLADFKSYFEIEKKYGNIRFNFYSWGDQQYRDYMTEVITSLEPRR